MGVGSSERLQRIGKPSEQPVTKGNTVAKNEWKSASNRTNSVHAVAGPIQQKTTPVDRSKRKRFPSDPNNATEGVPDNIKKVKRESNRTTATSPNSSSPSSKIAMPLSTVMALPSRNTSTSTGFPPALFFASDDPLVEHDFPSDDIHGFDCLITRKNQKVNSPKETLVISNTQCQGLVESRLQQSLESRTAPIFKPTKKKTPATAIASYPIPPAAAEGPKIIHMNTNSSTPPRAAAMKGHESNQAYIPKMPLVGKKRKWNDTRNYTNWSHPDIMTHHRPMPHKEKTRAWIDAQHHRYPGRGWNKGPLPIPSSNHSRAFKERREYHDGKIARFGQSSRLGPANDNYPPWQQYSSGRYGSNHDSGLDRAGQTFNRYEGDRDRDCYTIRNIRPFDERFPIHGPMSRRQTFDESFDPAPGMPRIDCSLDERYRRHAGPNMMERPMDENVDYDSMIRDRCVAHDDGSLTANSTSRKSPPRDVDSQGFGNESRNEALKSSPPVESQQGEVATHIRETIPSPNARSQHFAGSVSPTELESRYARVMKLLDDLKTGSTSAAQMELAEKIRVEVQQSLQESVMTKKQNVPLVATSQNVEGCQSQQTTEGQVDRHTILSVVQDQEVPPSILAERNAIDTNKKEVSDVANQMKEQPVSSTMNPECSGDVKTTLNVVTEERPSILTSGAQVSGVKSVCDTNPHTVDQETGPSHSSIGVSQCNEGPGETDQGPISVEGNGEKGMAKVEVEKVSTGDNQRPQISKQQKSEPKKPVGGSNVVGAPDSSATKPKKLESTGPIFDAILDPRVSPNQSSSKLSKENQNCVFEESKQFQDPVHDGNVCNSDCDQQTESVSRTDLDLAAISSSATKSVPVPCDANQTPRILDREAKTTDPSAALQKSSSLPPKKPSFRPKKIEQSSKRKSITRTPSPPGPDTPPTAELRFVFASPKVGNENSSNSSSRPNHANSASMEAAQRRYVKREESFSGMSREDALKEQERLLQEAAARMRMKHARQASFHDSSSSLSNSSMPNRRFTLRIEDIHKKFPDHWRYKDLYSRLGLPPTANDTMIKAQFRKLALIYHPDRNMQSGDTKHKFQAVTEAYHALMGT
jgi:hypothetical protein